VCSSSDPPNKLIRGRTERDGLVGQAPTAQRPARDIARLAAPVVRGGRDQGQGGDHAAEFRADGG